jgi:hypothetical protein
MMEVRHKNGVLLAGNLTFPTTSRGEVGKAGKRALNRHPHHHLSRGCGGVVGVAGGVNFTGGGILALPACLKIQTGCKPPIGLPLRPRRPWLSSPVDSGGIPTSRPNSPGVGL